MDCLSKHGYSRQRYARTWKRKVAKAEQTTQGSKNSTLSGFD